MDILIVDDNQIFIKSIKMLLKEKSDINNIYEAGNGKDGLEIIKEHLPEIVITNIGMPEMTGLELTRIIKSKYPYLKIIVLTINNNEEIKRKILDSEAEGYIIKNADRIELYKAIDIVADGGIYYSNEILNVKSS